MNYRTLGRTGWSVSEVSFGAWAIGGAWGNTSDDESLAALRRAAELGVNFFDTADVYGDGRSERLLAKLRKERSERIYIATKAGRRLSPHTAEGYNRENFTAFIERSLTNLQVEALDIVQLHCPPTEVYYTPEVFEVLDDLQRRGKILHYGVSVEKVEEAIKAIEYPGVKTVQIIFNLFRQRPADLFFWLCREKNIGVLARVPLSSGLLTGRITRETEFAETDHRFFNRHGEQFDRGETFSGVDLEIGLRIVDEIRPLVPAGMSLAQFALRWILDHSAVTCAIPGAKRAAQVEENVAASELAPLKQETHEATRRIYDARIRRFVHHRW
jgi:aryl-alcohol dehydrogenase-like predicted oxidoreductase